ncbi:MAG TPA: DODA-type extradiol aromatic ring-opening family dioxygenase [Elainellaceae cyanobacterium]
MSPIPSLFISHGAPDLPIRTGPTQDFLRQLFQVIPKPKAIVAVSAHWLTAHPTISKAAKPETIYDFGGFPQRLYELIYPAPGDPALAERVAELLTQAGFTPRFNGKRGYDHGIWTPLILADPDGTIPVVQLSMQTHEPIQHHFYLGKALSPLREEGVLILGSGAATHNLRSFSDSYDAPPPEWAVEFDDWITKTIAENDLSNLLNYRDLAPFASKNHPTEEHLFPLFVALGAGGRGRQIHHNFTYGAFSMAAYVFE